MTPPPGRSGRSGRAASDGASERPLRGLARRLNEQAVLHTIFHNGPLTRTRVAELTGLSKPTVSSIVDDLVETRLVQSTGRTSGQVGRTAALYRVDGSVGHVVGVDIGGTKITAAVADLYGELAGERTERTDTTDAGALIAQIRRLCRETAVAADVDWTSVRVIAVGVPGTVDPTSGEIRLAYNIPDLSGIALATEIQGDWAVSVLVENDVNLAAVGERWKGLAQECDNFVAISIGTGIGAGIVVGGELYTGTAGAAGEIPYLPLGMDPFDPDMHRRGPLEEAVAGRGIAHAATRRLAEGAASELSADCSAEDVFLAAERGDPLAREILDKEARTVALAIAAVAAVVAPELVVLGGGIGANPLLLDPVRRYTKQLTALPLPVERSALESRAALIGAIAYGLHEAQAMVLSPASDAFDAEALLVGGEGD